MSALRIGSLCTGYGGLDMAAQAVLGGAVAWHAQYEPPDKNGKPDRHQWAAQILAHRYPGVPNHGDITAIDFGAVEPVDILTAGFPCTDISLAGKQAGLRAGTRSGIWAHVARAIAELRPSLVAIENVRSLTSASADSDMEFCPWCLGDGGDESVLRALGAVLGDLADLGFDAEWACLRASDVGAPHQRHRIFILAWPAADAEDVGHERGGNARGRRSGSEDGGLAASDAGGAGLALGGVEPDRYERQAAERSGGQPSTDTDGRRLGPDEPDHGAGQSDATGGTAADTDGGRRRDEPGLVGGQRPAEHLQGHRPQVNWGQYASAIVRWERILGRTVPAPTDERGRLNPIFVEWMIGLPAGWVTDVPGIPRNAQLKALGNGVVPQQGAAALRVLLERLVPA